MNTRTHTRTHTHTLTQRAAEITPSVKGYKYDLSHIARTHREEDTHTHTHKAGVYTHAHVNTHTPHAQTDTRQAGKYSFPHACAQTHARTRTHTRTHTSSLHACPYPHLPTQYLCLQTQRESHVVWPNVLFNDKVTSPCGAFFRVQVCV